MTARSSKFLSLLLAVCVLCLAAAGGALAEEPAYVTASASGIAETLNLETGAYVAAGETISAVRAEKVFAPFDGTVTVVNGEEGDAVNGTVVEISPVSLYTVSCTVTGVAEKPENALIHVGETVYIRCMTDGTHWAEAVVVWNSFRRMKRSCRSE